MSIKALESRRREILELAARHGARNVRVFGSIARGDDRATSDVDLLVDIEPGRTLLDVIALEQDLEELLGRPVAVLTDGGLSPYLQQRILAGSATHSRTSPGTAAAITRRASTTACARTPRCESWKSSGRPSRIFR